MESKEKLFCISQSDVTDFCHRDGDRLMRHLNGITPKSREFNIQCEIAIQTSFEDFKKSLRAIEADLLEKKWILEDCHDFKLICTEVRVIADIDNCRGIRGNTIKYIATLKEAL